MPVNLYAASSGHSAVLVTAGPNKEKKAKRKARKEDKKNAKKQKHQEVIHKSENDADLEKIKAEKDKQKGIK